jgi:hypothetical protein
MSDRAQPAVTATSDPATMLTAVFNFLKQTDYSLQNLSYSYDTKNSEIESGYYPAPIELATMPGVGSLTTRCFMSDRTISTPPICRNMVT